MTLVAVTAITRTLTTTLPGESQHATVHRRFGDLIAQAGGTPVYADESASPAALAARIDALVLNGGGDVDPTQYGADAHAQLTWVDGGRDRFEVALVSEAIARGLPVLGVCRGLHVLNVALGGTLVQHLPEVTELTHRVDDPHDRPAHPVRLLAGSAIARDYAATALEVNSVHHQAVDRLGRGLEAVGWAPDGTIEAIEDATGRVRGIQWHPELMAPEHDPAQLGAFRALVEAAST